MVTTDMITWHEFKRQIHGRFSWVIPGESVEFVEFPATPNTVAVTVKPLARRLDERNHAAMLWRIQYLVRDGLACWLHKPDNPTFVIAVAQRKAA